MAPNNEEEVAPEIGATAPKIGATFEEVAPIDGEDVAPSIGATAPSNCNNVSGCGAS